MEACRWDNSDCAFTDLASEAEAMDIELAMETMSEERSRDVADISWIILAVGACGVLGYLKIRQRGGLNIVRSNAESANYQKL